ncbi:MAG TPA: ABC transporter permease [Pyrinomonadaceae bacterium]|nr:ABC transporter permease [Pyrinomonadaceae bacterium]
MRWNDILFLALRNLREARLRATLTTAGVAVGVAVIVTMVSFGLGLQRNTIGRFKELDLFNEITVFGRSLTSLISGMEDRPGDRRENPPAGGAANDSERKLGRKLDDPALEEIKKIDGIASVEPTVFFNAFVRANNRALPRDVSGAVAPNASSRFKEFAAGAMFARMDADEAVVDAKFIKDFNFSDAAAALGQKVEFLAPRKTTDEGEPLSFFGLPLESDEAAATGDELVARTFRIVGVLREDAPGGGRNMRGLLPRAGIYIPTPAAREWTLAYRGETGEVALALARAGGALAAGEVEGYSSAIVRVTDPSLLSDVRGKLDAAGFNTFSILDQLEQIRTFFLIINSVLGVLGGISLLVASLGIANTMLMSIFERTREIGIMKAIGAEDREIKLIFFGEALLIGLAGGVIGTLAAWGVDAVANRLVYHFALKPKGAAFVDFFALPPYLWLGEILFAVTVSIAAALYPASRAARIDPVQALRHD